MIESQISSSQGNARRSQRVLAHIRVNVRRREGANNVLSEDTHTLVVSAHGALLRLAMIVRPGDALTLKNLMSQEEKEIRVVRMDQKQTPKAVAVEFTTPAPKFWHIDFPPPDWEPSQ